MIVSWCRNFQYQYKRLISNDSKSHLPKSFFFIEKEHYAVSYDSRHRTPEWVFEHLTHRNVKGSAKRQKNKFKVDDEIPKVFRVALQDYNRTGYDKGHMAAAANYTFCKDAMSETFCSSNMYPQDSQFNSGYWAKLEKYVRELTERYRDVYVVSGGLYVPFVEKSGKRFIKYEVIGENNIAVPTHYFKVIKLIPKTGSMKREAYILPHKNIPLSIPLSEFKATVEEVEKLSGILFNE